VFGTHHFFSNKNNKGFTNGTQDILVGTPTRISANTHKHEHSLSLLSTGTSIKRGWVKLHL